MKFFTRLITFVKNAVRKIANMFKDRNPVEVINDTTKTVAAVATSGLAIYAGINAIRLHIIPSMKKNHSNRVSGHDYVAETRTAGSIESKLREMREHATQIGKKNYDRLNQEDLDALSDIAKTRNSFFQSLPPEEQMNVLEMEDFDFRAHAKKMKRNSKRTFFTWGERLTKMGVSPDDKPFREPVDYGFFNFILRPLDKFIHWIKNDPVPEKVRQIQVVDKPEIPSISCESAYDVVAAARNLDSYLNRNRSVCSEFNGVSVESLGFQEILADEIFRHRSLNKFKKAVNMRMAKSEYSIPNIFDMMDDKKGTKKGKKKKKKDSGDSDSFTFVENESKKKKHKGNKDDDKAESAADKRARELYRYHLEKAMAGEIDRKGYGF